MDNSRLPLITFKNLFLASILLLMPTLHGQQEEFEDEFYSGDVERKVGFWVLHQDAANEAKLSKLPQGQAMLNDDPLSDFQLNAPKNWNAQMEIVPVEGMPFEQAIRVTIDDPKKGRATLRAYNTTPLTRKDIGLAIFWARSVPGSDKPENVDVDFVLQMNQPDWFGSIKRDLTLSPEWQKYYIPFKAKVKGPKGITAQAGEERIQFQLEAMPQSFEIAGLSCVNYGVGNVTFEQLPVTTISYRGRELDAPWRKEANERIEKIRKGDFTVEVVDASGNPVPDAQVSLKMTRHAFPFGSTFHGPRAVGPESETEDSKQYIKHFRENFTRAVFEGSTKWAGWNKPTLRQEAIDSLEWLQENNISFRGHVLVYPKWRKHDGQLKKTYKDDPEGLQKAILAHIEDIAGTFKGLVTDWDVINEHSADPSSWPNWMGREVMVEWFKKAAEVDPGSGRLLTDNGIAITVGGTLYNPKQKAYYSDIDFLIENDAPITGAGLQSRYFWHRISPPEASLEVFDILAAKGLDLHVTEFDIILEDEELQGDLMRDYLTAAFSHPAMQSFIMWGFWDGAHHRNNAPLYRADWSLKPAGKAYRDLVFGQWWTEAEGKTDAEGDYSTRGFFGDYEVSVTAGGKTVTQAVAFDENDKKAVVKLDS